MELAQFPHFGAFRHDAFAGAGFFSADPAFRGEIRAKSGRKVPKDAIADPDKLLKWLGPDRAAVTFVGAGDLMNKSDALVAIVRQWIEHV